MGAALPKHSNDGVVWGLALRHLFHDPVGHPVASVRQYPGIQLEVIAAADPFGG
jgi:hypothetical protein